MAMCGSQVLIAFEDEEITDKHKGQVNFATNKMGGRPDLPGNCKLEPQTCPLCQLPRLLVLQIYAPLETSTSHRTLYLFACINPNCWNHSASWVCIRVMSQGTVAQPEATSPSNVVTSTPNVTDWCMDADNWGDEPNANCGEENGNVMPTSPANDSNQNFSEEEEDENDESCSLDDSIKAGLEHLTVDDRNANSGALGGAVGRQNSPSATAEIEGDESEVVSIDAPLVPQRDIAALLHEAAPLPHFTDSSKSKDVLQFASSFISVWDEIQSSSTISDRHVKELLQEYQQKNEGDLKPRLDSGGSPGGGGGDTNFEKYEKSHPTHGDKMFHHFVSKIQMNPGQILRYSRDADAPLLLQPLQEVPRKCAHCQGDVIFEFQVLPTIIPKLKLATDGKACSRLDFGTVLVFTCAKSCWNSDTHFRHETVVVQSESYADDRVLFLNNRPNLK